MKRIPAGYYLASRSISESTESNLKSERLSNLSTGVHQPILSGTGMSGQQILVMDHWCELEAYSRYCRYHQSTA